MTSKTVILDVDTFVAIVNAKTKFQPQQPLVCDSFKNCEGLSRVAFMDGNGVVMLGKVISCERNVEGDEKAGKKK